MIQNLSCKGNGNASENQYSNMLNN